MVGKLLEGFEPQGHEGRLVDGTKQWSRGVKVLYGESAEEQERVAEELGVEVDVKEDDYCCARKPWIDIGKTVCLSGGGREPRRL